MSPPVRSLAATSVIPTAGLITLVMFTGLTVAVFVTGHDFAFLSTSLIIGGFAAMGFILCGMLFGFQMGKHFHGRHDRAGQWLHS